MKTKHNHPYSTKSYLCIDTECIGNKWQNADGTVHKRREFIPFMVGMMNQDGKCWQWEWNVDMHQRLPIIPHSDIEEIKQVIGRHKFLVFHNAAFDIQALLNLYLAIPKVLPRKRKRPVSNIDLTARWSDIHDTMLMAKIYRSNGVLGLKPLASVLDDIETDDEELLKDAVKRCRSLAKAKGLPIGIKTIDENESDKGFAFDYFMPRELQDSSLCAKYNIQDVFRTGVLFEYFMDWFNSLHKVDEQEAAQIKAYELERRLLPQMVAMQNAGITIRLPTLNKRLSWLRTNIEQTERTAIQIATKYANFDNIRSTKQVKEVLFDTFKFPVLNATNKGNPSVDVATLSELIQYANTKTKAGRDAKEFLELLVCSRKYNTYYGYLTGYKERLHQHSKNFPKLYPRFHQVGTNTTRLASYDPNGQNVGKEPDPLTGISLREVFGPEPGYEWYPIDYSQLELRIIAALAGEERMLEVFDSGGDIHVATADFFKLTYDARNGGKRLNYLIVYGGGVWKMNTIVESYGGVPQGSDPLRSAYPTLSTYIDDMINYAWKNGYVWAVGGYKLYTPENRSYAGVNYIVQGSAGVIIKLAMVLVWDYLKANRLHDYIQLVLNVHDELIFSFRTDTPNKETHLKNIAGLMEEAGIHYGIKTPVDVSIVTKSWDNKKEIKL